jgi:hypothetical protein
LHIDQVLRPGGGPFVGDEVLDTHEGNRQPIQTNIQVRCTTWLEVLTGRCIQDVDTIWWYPN